MGKLIFIDIDGTIRWFDGRIPESAKSAIRKARKNGHEVCICSGRPLSLIEEEVMEIGFDGVVSCAGTYVTYHGNCIRETCFEEGLLHELCGYLMERGCLIELQRYDRTYLPKCQEGIYQELMNEMRKSFEVENARDLEPYPGLTDHYREIANVEKVMFFSREISYQSVLEDWTERVNMTPFSIPTLGIEAGEISPANVNKTSGILSILEHSSYKREDIIAIGDSDNDIDMLQFAGVGIAMGNGTEGAKKAADWQTDELLNDGLEKAFRKLGLIS